MKTVILVFIAAAALFLVACDPSGDELIQLQPGIDSVVSYDTSCGGNPQPSEWDSAVGTWNAVYEAVIGYQPFGKVIGGCGTVSMTWGICPAPHYACTQLNISPSDGYINRAFVRFDQSWNNLDTYWSGWKMAAALKGLGQVLGLKKHITDNCYVDPYYGASTVMGRINDYVSNPPCASWPGGDIYGVCLNYDRSCPVNGGFNAASIGPDYDGDGIEDAVDNCMTNPNPLQQDRDIDGAGNACDNDDDGDGRPDTAENYMGTDPLDNCRDNSSHDAWPPDPDKNGSASIGDVVQLFGHGKLLISHQNPLYQARSDMDANLSLNIGDVTAAFGGGVILTTCTTKVETQAVDAIEATEQYRTLDTAESAGYQQITQPISGYGAIFLNESLWTDDTFDPNQPEGLLYDSNGLLSGALYFGPMWTGAPAPEGFVGSGDVWTTRQGFCIDGNLLPVWDLTEEQCLNAGGFQYWEELGYSLIAWLYRLNPDGLFTEQNPTVQ
ncbi:MAG: thrombospondin type 3 repeat-containing protein [Candidatus Woykebacteria bacterium]